MPYSYTQSPYYASPYDDYYGYPYPPPAAPLPYYQQPYYRDDRNDIMNTCCMTCLATMFMCCCLQNLGGCREC
ncbi:hypothetical protein RB195_001898 [Necator americanus]